MKAMGFRKSILCLFHLIIFLSSCTGRTYYHGIQMAPMPSIISNTNSTEEKNNFYFGFDGGNVGSVYKREHNYILRSHYLFLFNTKYSELNFGITGYKGEYKVNNFYGYDGIYGYCGYGPEFNGNIFFKIQNISIGLGLYYAYLIEEGDYRQFRIDVNNSTYYNFDTNLGKHYLSFYPIFKRHLSNSSILTFQCGIGDPGFISPSFSFHHEHYTLWIGCLPYTIKGFDEQPLRFSSIILGAGYKF